MEKIIIGLTGGIASGKSTVSRWLLEQGYQVVDADLLAREVVLPYQPSWYEIVSLFGNDILLPNDEIDRKKLGALIFADARLREGLNAIVHPAVIKRIQEAILDKRKNGSSWPPLFLDIPLLYEAGLEGLADENWLVYVGATEQMVRLIKRDKLSCDEAKQRINAQWPLDKKKVLANLIIDNSGLWEETEKQLVEILSGRKQIE